MAKKSQNPVHMVARYRKGVDTIVAGFEKLGQDYLVQ